MENTDFYSGWSRQLLTSLSTCCGQDACRAIMHHCSEYHYQQNNMDEILNGFVGDLNGFLIFLSENWGWKITCDEEKQIIIADENKSECICPITNHLGKENVSGTLCYCSEGFAEKMFSKVTKKAAHARVIRSILLGDASCIYEIHIDQ